MCGLAGIFTRTSAADPAALEEMLAVQAHRGPDDRGTWSEGPVALGHVRLTILDLTDRAHQPMVLGEGPSALVYNGEVYNFPDLRRALEAEGERFASTGDTEVVARALLRWGPRRAVERMNGMFAFAFWDGARRALWLARDRMGIKPLYAADTPGALVFASEIKALLAHPDVPCRPDLVALPPVLMHGRVSAPRTLFEGIEALEPGALWKVTADGIERTRTFDALRDVDPARIVEEARRDPDARSAPDRVESVLRESVRLHLASDVPVATMCSGGVDSSLVTAYARDDLADLSAYVADVGGEVSEWAQAAKVGAHLGVPVERVATDRADHLALMPLATWHLDAPSCFSSDTALLRVARRCRADGIKVLLTGEGSDELFGGYPWQAATWRTWRRKEGLRYRLTRSRRGRARDAMRLGIGPLNGDAGRHVPGLRWRLLTILQTETELQGPRLLEHLAPVEPASDRAFLASCIGDLYRHMSSILQRHDRMGMAASMEMRVPFLENAVIDLGLHAPRRWKLHRGISKWVVKTVAERHLPDDVVHAKKKGFPVPPAFRRGPLRLVEGGALAEVLGWRQGTAREVVALAGADPDGAPWLGNAEVWARVFLRREDPAELGERLVALAGA